MLSRPLIDRIAFFGISWYAILIVGAILIGYFLCCNEARRIHLPQDTILDFMLYAIPLGIICARLYYIAFRFNDYSDNLAAIFHIREGGLAIYGGVIGGLIAARLVSKKHKISMLTLLDVIAPALVLGQGIGRWGNYVNMEAYGLRISEEALQFFPFAVEIPVGEVWYWHMGNILLRILLGYARFCPASLRPQTYPPQGRCFLLVSASLLFRTYGNRGTPQRQSDVYQ